MKQRSLSLNTLTSFALQVTTIVCGFILPRLILKYYGSDINGVVNSITQFLSVISFLELGVGSVVQQALYKPLAEGNNQKLSEIVTSSGRFFRKIAIVLAVYVAFLIAFYGKIGKGDFDFAFNATLIGAMCATFFARYYFGVTDNLLLIADQRGYVGYITQIVTLIANTVAGVILINLGQSIQVVKLATSLIYLARPLFLRLYIRKNYKLNRHARYDKEPLEQKWNGVAQHISSVVLDNTDTIVLTVLADFASVSIYSVYFLVVNGMKQLFVSSLRGVQSALGDLYARKENEKLERLFKKTLWLNHSLVTLLFTIAAVLIVPFVLVYTKGVDDADYNVPVFALLITLANGIHCLRTPYHIMILSAGHFKKTQWSYIASAVINIVVSVVTVKFIGLIGVAVGTLVAMLFQTIWMAVYDSRNFVKISSIETIKQLAADCMVFVPGYLVGKLFTLENLDYFSWVKLAVCVSAVVGFIALAVNMVLYFGNIKSMAKNLIKRKKPND